jgi:lipid II:glycine glycyltransferase (peptidoglycan interpeptide bridge formation enzyme)
MVLRLRPHLWEGEHDAHCDILIEEGFARQRTETRSRSIIMDLRPSLDELSRGLHQKWRNCLNAARKRSLEIIEGEDHALFEAFEPIHSEMQDRKRFVEGTSPAQYRIIQKQLRADEKMRVVLCKSEGKVCAGAIGSAIGDTGIYLFGATSNDGMKTGGSYLAQWNLIEWLKSRGCHWYNLNGINPVKNEGTYRFKSRLAGVHGREVDYLGQFDAYPNAAVGFCVRVADRVRNKRLAVR